MFLEKRQKDALTPNGYQYVEMNLISQKPFVVFFSLPFFISFKRIISKDANIL